MKKLLMMAAVLLSTIVAKAEDNISATLKVTSEKDQATVHVNLDNTSTFVAFQFDIAFPEGMTFDKSSTTIKQAENRLVNNGTVDLSAVGGTQTESTNFTVVYNWINDNTIRVIGYNLGNKEILLDSGEILAITVKATEATSSVSNWTAKFDTSDFVTLNALEEMNVNITNNDKTAVGEEEVAWMKGDCDHNNVVNVFDVSAAVNKSLSKTPAEPFFESEADVDGNGIVNVFDVSWIVNESLGKNK